MGHYELGVIVYEGRTLLHDNVRFLVSPVRCQANMAAHILASRRYSHGRLKYVGDPVLILKIGSLIKKIQF